MNSKAKETWMTNTLVQCRVELQLHHFKGFYTPQRYDNHAANQTAAL